MPIGRPLLRLYDAKRRQATSSLDLYLRDHISGYRELVARITTSEEPSPAEATRRHQHAANYEKEAEGVRRELKKVEKAQADRAELREQIEDRMRQV